MYAVKQDDITDEFLDQIMQAEAEDLKMRQPLK